MYVFFSNVTGLDTVNKECKDGKIQSFGSVVGESEKNTKAILEATKGKVLVIDEAYMLCSNLGGSSLSSEDTYRKAVIDTIVSEVHSVPGEDRAVLLLGYQEQMEDMLRKVNQGLNRRFPMESAFFFEDRKKAVWILTEDWEGGVQHFGNRWWVLVTWLPVVV